MARDREPPPDLVWRPAPGLVGVNLLEAHACSRSWRVFHETYSFCTVLHVASGRGRIKYRRWTYDASPRTVQVFEPGEVHCCDSLRGHADYRGLFVPQETLSPMLAGMDGRASWPHSGTPLVPRAFEAFERFHLACETPPSDPLEVECLFVQAMGRFLRAASAVVRVSPVDCPAVVRARQYVDDLLARELDARIRLDELTAISGAESPFSLLRDFKRVLGVSPIAYVRARRLVRSQMLLRAGYTARRVALESGYSEEAFSRAFVRQFGVAPGHFRAKHRSVFTRPMLARFTAPCDPSIAQRS